MWKKLLKEIYHTLWLNPFKPWFLITLVVINILGSIYGYYWYRYQLMATPKHLWFFVPDSPLSTTLTAIALIFMLLKKRNSLFEWLAFTAVIKYGLWAVVIISHFGLTGGTIKPEIWMLWFSHLGMAVEGMIFLRHAKVSWREITIGLIWMLFNDLLDYSLGIYPYLYASYQWPVAIITAVGLSLLLSLPQVRFNFRRSSLGKKTNSK
jgi:uncharacterized membrane protein YpjA